MTRKRKPRSQLNRVARKIMSRAWQVGRRAIPISKAKEMAREREAKDGSVDS